MINKIIVLSLFLGFPHESKAMYVGDTSCVNVIVMSLIHGKVLLLPDEVLMFCRQNQDYFFQ